MGVIAADIAMAQQADENDLPDINVSAPSPIVRRRPAQPAAGPSEPAPPSNLPPVAAETFVPTTVVTQQELTRSPGTTIGDVLFEKPGVTATTFAPGSASRPVIRGLDNNRVRVQENGVSSMDMSTLGEDHSVPIDPMSASQIEVIRGPATLRYGSTAIGGVVDVTNNRIPQYIIPGGLQITTQGALTSVDRGAEGATTIEGGAGNFAFHGDFFGRTADDYRTPRGVQANTSMHSLGQSVGGSFIGNQGFAGLAVEHFQSLYHIPGTEAAETNTRIDMEQVKLTGKAEYRPDNSVVEAVRAWGGVTDYHHFELANEDGFDGVHSTFRNREQEGRVEAQFTPVSTWLGPLVSALGIQAGHQQLGTDGEASGLLAPAETTRVAAYLFNELNLTNTLKFQAAGRVESVNVDGTASIFPSDFLPNGMPIPEYQSDRGFLPMSASIGLLQELPAGIVASLTGQYVQRAPTAPELFSKGVHDATETFEIGDPNLGIEAATTVEAGLKRAQGQFRFEANAYYTYYKDFIYKRVTGIECGDEFSTCGVESGLTQIVYSQQDATFYGAELSGQLDVSELGGGTLGVDGQYDFVHARFSDGTNVPRIPPHRLGGGVYWRDVNWFARVGLLHAFAQHDTGVNETPTPGYNLLRAEVSYTQKRAGNGPGPRGDFTLGLVGTNLLNDIVRNSVSFNKDQVMLPGRGVRLFARVTF